MMKMRNSDIWGNPIRFELEPISDLFSDELFVRNALFNDEGRQMKADSIKRWFLPLYMDELKDYQVVNKCPEGYKLFGNWEQHYCEGKNNYFHSFLFHMSKSIFHPALEVA